MGRTGRSAELGDGDDRAEAQAKEEAGERHHAACRPEKEVEARDSRRVFGDGGQDYAGHAERQGNDVDGDARLYERERGFPDAAGDEEHHESDNRHEEGADREPHHQTQ